MGSQIDLRWANNPPLANEFVFGALLVLDTDTGPLLATASEKRAMGDDTPDTPCCLPELVLGVHVDKRACIHHRRNCECARPARLSRYIVCI